MWVVGIYQQQFIILLIIKNQNNIHPFYSPIYIYIDRFRQLQLIKLICLM